MPRRFSELLPTLRPTTRLSATTSARNPGGSVMAPSSGSGTGSGGGVVVTASVAHNAAARSVRFIDRRVYRKVLCRCLSDNESPVELSRFRVIYIRVHHTRTGGK